MWPDEQFYCLHDGWMWPGIALCLPQVAPQVAPQNLVSRANIRTAEPANELHHEMQWHRPDLRNPGVQVATASRCQLTRSGSTTLVAMTAQTGVPVRAEQRRWPSGPDGARFLARTSPL
jgi:hypothetical protein